MLGSLAIATLVSTLAAAPEPPREASSAELVEPSFAAAPAKVDAGGDVVVEQCDGSRTKPTDGAKKCVRWKIEWSKDGKIWGVTSADSLQSVVAERERVLGYARQHARLFGTGFDPRWSDPSAPICDACEQNQPGTRSGLWGDAQAFGANPTQDALVGAREKLQTLETAITDVHLPRLRDIARLSVSPGTAKLAKQYAKNLDAAVVDLAKLQLDLENAAIFRSTATVEKASKAIDARSKALEQSAAALVGAVAKTVQRAHGGRYFEEAGADKGKSQLVVAFAGEKVTATFVQGESEAVWFEGAVFLDGRVAGRSLVAPENTPLKCTAHTLECGYVHVPAILRFDERKDEKGKRHVVELWFQQSSWVHAKPFVR